MMFLSRIPLDTANRNTLRALRSPSKFHGALESAFPGERQRNLWRLDPFRGRLYLMLLSPEKPDLHSFCKQFSSPSDQAETRDYEVLLNKIKEGQNWRFRLTANPTISASHEKEGERGKVFAHITTEHQQKWLLERAEKHGFHVTLESFFVTEKCWVRFYKKDGTHPVTLLQVTYEGVLEVTDADRFVAALTQGIGRGKAYGMGLLTVMPV